MYGVYGVVGVGGCRGSKSNGCSWDYACKRRCRCYNVGGDRREMVNVVVVGSGGWRSHTACYKLTSTYT